MISSTSSLWLQLDDRIVNIDSFLAVHVEGTELIGTTPIGAIHHGFPSPGSAAAAYQRIVAELKAQGRILDVTDLAS